jgi:uncharacterized protein (TIGR01777 family)
VSTPQETDPLPEIGWRPNRARGGALVRVAIAGGTGMIGTALADALRARGDEVLILTRGPARGPHDVKWDPAKGSVDTARLEGLDAVYNFAGAPIANRPWTKQRRQVLWESRIDSTKVLIDALGALQKPPPVYLGTGGLGRFGNRGDEIIDDDAAPGTGFLAELSVAWEEAHLQARRIGCRPCVLRMNIVLSPKGGAFPLMVTPFRIGIGGWLGNGLQYTPWITIRDAVAAFLHLQGTPSCEGGFNGTIPEPPTNYEWSKALGRALHRPVLTHAPKWALRGALGELADELLIASCRAVPRKLLESGFTFQDVESEAAFRWLLEEMAKG